MSPQRCDGGRSIPTPRVAGAAEDELVRAERYRHVVGGQASPAPRAGSGVVGLVGA